MSESTVSGTDTATQVFVDHRELLFAIVYNILGYAVMVMDLTPEGDQVSGVYIVTNPDKLTHVHKGEPGENENEEGAA